MKRTPVRVIKDGFKNILKGLGGEKDARTKNQFVAGIRITQKTANDLYTYNWICGKAVDAPVEDAIQNWRSLLIEDPEKKEAAEKAMKEIMLKGAVEQALKWSRVFGGAVIIPVIDGHDPAEPLEPDKIPRDSLRSLIVLDRYNIYPGDINRNILSENFGKPEFYTVSRDGQLIHHSRVIRFDGSKPTIMEQERENYWGLSIFTRLWEPVSDYQTTCQSIANLVFESNVDVYRINGLNSLIAEKRDDLVKERLKIAHEMKSIINGIALDAADEYDKKTNTFANLPEIDDRFAYKVAGAIPMPVTRLLGREPAGLSATGESDERIYEKSLKNIQDNQIRPALDILDPVIMMSAFGSFDDFEYVFNPLQQATPAQQAEIDHKRAQTDAIYLAEDVIEPLDAKTQLAENGTYVTMTPERIQKEAAEAEELFFEETEDV